MKAETFCLDAARLVSGDRESTHGDKLENHRNIAAIWNGYLHDVLKRPLTPLDAANMMEALKIARRKIGRHNADDYTDGAGYAAVAGEIASRMEAIEDEVRQQTTAPLERV